MRSRCWVEAGKVSRASGCDLGDADLRGLLEAGQGFAGVLAAGGGAGGVIVNGCGLVAAEAADAGDGFRYRTGGNQVGIRAWKGAAWDRSYGRANGGIGELISALLIGSCGDDVVHEHG